MIDLEAFIRNPEQDFSAFEDEVSEEMVKTWPVSGGNWVSGFVILGKRCYVFGGNDFFDGRIFSTLHSALGAIAYNLGRLPSGLGAAGAWQGLSTIRPKQGDYGRNWHFLEIVGAGLDLFLVVGPVGPQGELCKGRVSADNATYEAAGSGLTPR